MKGNSVRIDDLSARTATRQFLWMHLAMHFEACRRRIATRNNTNNARERNVSHGEEDEDEREEILHIRHVSAEASVDPLNVIIRSVAPAEFSHVRS